MPANEDLTKDELSKDQPAAAELEIKTDELKPEDTDKIAGGGQHHVT
jgi:hypothetical protein